MKGALYNLKCILLILFIVLILVKFPSQLRSYLSLTNPEPFLIHDNILQRVTKLQKRCGELCNTNKVVQTEHFIGTVKASVSDYLKKSPPPKKKFISQISCKEHFALMSDLSMASSPIVPPKLEHIPEELKKLYSYNDRLVQ